MPLPAVIVSCFAARPVVRALVVATPDSDRDTAVPEVLATSSDEVLATEDIPELPPETAVPLKVNTPAVEHVKSLTDIVIQAPNG